MKHRIQPVHRRRTVAHIAKLRVELRAGYARVLFYPDDKSDYAATRAQVEHPRAVSYISARELSERDRIRAEAVAVRALYDGMNVVERFYRLARSQPGFRQGFIS